MVWPLASPPMPSVRITPLDWQVNSTTKVFGWNGQGSVVGVTMVKLHRGSPSHRARTGPSKFPAQVPLQQLLAYVASVMLIKGFDGAGGAGGTGGGGGGGTGVELRSRCTRTAKTWSIGPFWPGGPNHPLASLQALECSATVRIARNGSQALVGTA